MYEAKTAFKKPHKACAQVWREVTRILGSRTKPHRFEKGSLKSRTPAKSTSKKSPRKTRQAQECSSGNMAAKYQ